MAGERTINYSVEVDIEELKEEVYKRLSREFPIYAGSGRESGERIAGRVVEGLLENSADSFYAGLVELGIKYATLEHQRGGSESPLEDEEILG